MVKKLLSTLIALLMTSSMFVSANKDALFSDIDGHWAQETIEELAGKGIINGKGNGIFDPKGNVTRAEFIKLLMSTSGENYESVEGDLVDIPARKWFNPYIYAALSKNIFTKSEIANNEFLPNNTADRETVALWAVRYLGLSSSSTSTTFADDENISNKSAVAAAFENGIITGDAGKNTFRPKDTLSRAESAVIIKRVIDKLSVNGDSEETTATITLSDGDIKISGSGATADGGTLTITSGGVYEISGTLTKGQIIVDASKEEVVELILSGVNIKSEKNAAIYCKNAKDLVINLKANTENILTDAKDYKYEDEESKEPNSTLYSDCDLDIKGSGYLTVNANFKHGILTKDDLNLKSGIITVKAANDGIRGKDSVEVRNGKINITAAGDGMKSDQTNNPDKGWVLIENGEITITSVGDAIQAETDLTVNNGILNIITSGTPTGNSDSQKGLKSGGLLTIANGKININTADDAINANSDVSIKNGTIEITTSDDAIKSDTKIDISGSKLTINKCYEGLDGTEVFIAGGEIFITVENNGIALTDSESAICEINGGKVIICSCDDAVNTGETGKFKISDKAFFFGTGIGSDPEVPTDASIPTITAVFETEIPKDSLISVKSESGDEIFTYTITTAANRITLSSSQLKAGESYTITANDSNVAAKAE